MDNLENLFKIDKNTFEDFAKSQAYKDIRVHLDNNAK